MADTSPGNEVETVELETRDGSDSLHVVKTDGYRSPTASRTEGENDDDRSSVNSSHSKILDYNSSEEKEEFDENLPTYYSLLGPATPTEDVVIEEIVIEEEGKSEATKTVPDSTDNSSTETAGHIRSGKYYVPFAPNLTLLVKGSGLLTSLINKAKRDPCGATYQRCHPTVPMMKYQSPQILDSSPMRCKY